MTRWTKFATVFGIVAILALTAVLITLKVTTSSKQSLNERLRGIRGIAAHPEISCSDLTEKRPLVLLALGQSNAGNHGDVAIRPTGAIPIFADGKCVLAASPLPGATGAGGSIWQYLPDLLSQNSISPPVVISVLAVDATAISDWTSPQSRLKDRLVTHIALMGERGLPPDLILWQQGEADARGGTTRENYTAELGKLADILDEAGSDVPIILAKSTVCRSSPDTEIREAVEKAIVTSNRFRSGPDTDALSGEVYRNGCHLTATGLESAARMWTSVIVRELSVQNVKKPGNEFFSVKPPSEPSNRNVRSMESRQ